MLDKLIYTNSAGYSVEFSTSSLFYVNIRKDVTGLFGVKTTISTDKIVDVDGEIETGYQVQSRDIGIKGTIKSRSHAEQDILMNQLTSVLSPFYTGVLRYEGAMILEIDVRVEESPDPQARVGQRWPTFSVGMVALNPNWRMLSEISTAITNTGTNIYYDGTKACGMEIEITALSTIGTKEVASLAVTAACSSSGNATVTLNGTGFNVALDSGVQTTAELVATALRAASYTGWTTGGTGTTVTFTSTTVGSKTDATYSAGSTGATGTMTTATQGDVSGDIESLTVTNGTNVETVTFRTAGSVELVDGDVIILDTTPGAVSILLNNVKALSRIDFNNTVFPRLYPGKNVITWLAYGNEADFTVTVRHTPQYIAL